MNNRMHRDPSESSRVRARFRSLRLRWTDPESGERLIFALQTSGGADWLPEVFRSGFEVLDRAFESSDHSNADAAPGVRQWRSVARDRRAPGASG